MVSVSFGITPSLLLSKNQLFDHFIIAFINYCEVSYLLGRSNWQLSA